MTFLRAILCPAVVLAKEDVRKFAAEQKISEEQALQVGLKRKAREFVEKGAEG